MRVLVWQRKYQNAEIPSGKRKHGLAAQETPESSWVLCFLLQRALPWSHWRFCSCLNVLCEQLSHWYLFRFAVLVVFPSPFKAQLSIKLPHLVNCSSSLSGCANQRSNFAFLFPEGDAEGKIDHSFLMKSVNSIKPRFSALSWGEGEMLSRCPSSPALSVKPHLQSIAGLYGFSLFPELVWILVWGSRMFFFFSCSSELDLIEDVLFMGSLGWSVENPIHWWAAAWGSPWQHPCLWDVCGTQPRWSRPGAATFFRKEKFENLMTTVVLLCLQTIWKMRTGYKYLTNENWKESSG